MENCKIEKEKVLLWIDLALSDLRAAKILYESGEHRTSYLLFQQAVEKANKSAAAFEGLDDRAIKTEIGHNPLHKLRRTLVRKKQEVGDLIESLEIFPKGSPHALGEPKFDLKDYAEMIEKSISNLDKLRSPKYDLINIPLDEIRNQFDELEQVEYEYEDYPKRSGHDFVIEGIQEYVRWISNFETPAALEVRQAYEQLRNSPNDLKSVQTASRIILRSACTLAFIHGTFLLCAIFTVQHYELTRYPIDGRNPLRIYNKKLPVVREQPYMMAVFDRALQKFKRIVNTGLK